MLTMILPIAAAVWIYRTAKENGYNAVLWAILTPILAIGLQLLVGIVYGIYLYSKTGSQEAVERQLAESQIMLTVLSVVLMLIPIGLVSYYVSRVRETDQVMSPPAPPSSFNQ